MFLKSKPNPKDRARFFKTLGPIGWLALAFGIFLGRLDVPSLAFISGVLTGFSAVANLAYIYAVTRFDI